MACSLQQNANGNGVQIMKRQFQLISSTDEQSHDTQLLQRIRKYEQTDSRTENIYVSLHTHTKPLLSS